MSIAPAEGGGAAAEAAAGPTAKSALRSSARATFEAARQKGAQKAAEAKAAADAQLTAATEKATVLAKENETAIKANVAAAQQFGEDMKEMSALPAPALQSVAASAVARAEAQYAANKAMIDRNREAAMQLKATAEAAAADAKSQAVAAGNEALARGEHMASVAVDLARGEFEARYQKALEQEGKLKEFALEVERREKQVSLLRSKSEPNWPRKFCCIEPMVHHSILGDIPVERQAFVKKCYVNYYVTIFLLVFNCALALAMQVVPNVTDPTTNQPKKSNSLLLQHFIVSVVFLLGIVFAFIVWYWPTYKALATGVSSQYLASFVGLLIAFFFDLLCLLGPIGYGGCGLMYALEIQQTKSSNAFIPVLIIALLWIFQALFFLYMAWRVRRHYRQDKASLAKAKAEMFASEVRSALVPGL